MTDEHTPRPTRLRRTRNFLLWPFRHWRLLLLAVIGLAVLNMLHNARLTRQVAQARAEIQAAGGMISPEQLTVPGMSDLTNAAIPYWYANTLLLRAVEAPEGIEATLEKMKAQALPACLPQDTRRRGRTDADQDQETPLTDRELATIDAFMVDTAPAMAIVEDAAELPHFRFGPYTYGPGQFASMLDGLTAIRNVTRHLGYRAIHSLRSGDYSAALHWSHLALRLAQQAKQQPTLLGGMMQVALADQALLTLQTVLTHLPPEQEVGPEIEKACLPLRDITSWEFVLESERVWFVLQQQLMAGLGKGIRLRSELGTHAQFNAIVAAVKVPDHATRETLLAPLRAQAKARPGFPIWDTTVITAPTWLRSLQHHLQSVSRADMASLALALRSYKQRTGAYPDTLAQAVPDAPVDPLNGEPYHYERAGEGYILKSGNRGPSGLENEGSTWCMVR